MNKLAKAAAFATGTVLAMGVATPAFASSDATGVAAHSPGFLSGNVLQHSIHIPINHCGNTDSYFALLNPAFGNTCVNVDR